MAVDGMSASPRPRSKTSNRIFIAQTPRSARFSNGGYVPLVVEAPGRVSHQADGLVAAPPSASLPGLDRVPQHRGSLPREVRERPTHRIDDVRIRASELGGAQAHVQASCQTVEDVEAWRGVLDLDGVEG